MYYSNTPIFYHSEHGSEDVEVLSDDTVLITSVSVPQSVELHTRGPFYQQK